MMGASVASPNEAGLYMRRTNRAHDSSDPRWALAPAVRNSLFAGKVGLWQPVRGYRVNIDSLLLAHFAAACRPKAQHLVDLGAGVGAVALAYAHLARARQCTLLEREPGLAVLAERNLREARLDGSALVVDLGEDLPAALRGVADIVVSNPPFFAGGTRAGPDGADGIRQRARSGPLEPFLRAAAAVMGRRAYAYFAYPASALPEIIGLGQGVGLVAKRLRLVHSFATTPARLVLLELRRAKPGGLVIEPSIVEWITRGTRSPDLAALVAGRLLRSPQRR
jgi:tRNA1Val (adenine37-N6)-methyltransferase